MTKVFYMHHNCFINTPPQRHQPISRHMYFTTNARNKRHIFAANNHHTNGHKDVNRLA
ncbi:unknown [Prevotella sp. CAG:1185]|nr:unknown [Prevotella sp. CAG:1185]